MEIKQLVLYNADNGTWVANEETLPSYPCRQEDLDQFYPLQESQVNLVAFQTQFTCIDHSRLKVKGDSNSVDFSTPYAVFSLPKGVCRDDPYDNQCIVSKEVETALHHKKISLWTNRMRFDQLLYTRESPVIKESHMLFYDVPNLQEVRNFEI